jgi:hypothetical protein
MQDKRPTRSLDATAVAVAVEVGFDKEWKDYQNISRDQLEPIMIPPGVGTSTRPDYTSARYTLSELLIKMKEIIREA